MASWLETIFWGPGDNKEFVKGIQTAINTLGHTNIFFGDNLFTFGRNLSFLDMPKFMAAFEKNSPTPTERAVIWRVFVMTWAAEVGLRREGDFVECGCGRGANARIIVDFLDFAHTAKQFYLYDMFDHGEDTAHVKQSFHSPELYDTVKQRFADLPNVHVIQGRVPDILKERSPEKIAYLHIDLNDADAEIGALELLFDRVVPGAMIILDDYGWHAYRAQKLVEDTWLAARGYRVLELPTGQGMVLK
jgi:O-methyltransferase